MLESLMQYQLIAAFFTLTALEIVLGIDNIVFIALLVQHLSAKDRKRARFIGLSLAMGLRILLLLGISWVIGLTEPLFHVATQGFSGKDILMLLGGFFLMYKGTGSIHEMLTGETKSEYEHSKGSFISTVLQILVIDLVFSFDSVITAVGMTSNIPLIVAAMLVAMVVMLVASGFIARFIDTYPTLKMLALSFILMIGILLIAEGLEFHVPRGYIYFGMSFSLIVEILNLMAAERRKKK